MMTKKLISDFAIFDGPPAFNQTLHVGQPNIGNRKSFISRINDALDRRWLTNNGMFVRDFEENIANMIGVKHCIAMCNGTIALEVAIRALGMSGEVIIPSFTFVATAHCLQWQEITPIFCDINPNSYTIDPQSILKHITPKTTGIIGVHLWGTPCDIDTLSFLAEKHNLKLLFDASHAFVCTHNKQFIGRFGHAEIFSFHATKFINTFEGGAIATNDDHLANKIRLMRNFGFAGMDNVIYLGTNGKMNEISAAMGLTCLENIDEFIESNRMNYHSYKKGFDGIKGIRLKEYNENEKNNYQYIVLEIDENVIGLGRNQIMQILHAENIRVRRYFYPCCHRMEPYRSYYPNSGLLLPQTESLAERVLCFPTGTSISSDQIDAICQIVRQVCTMGTEFHRSLNFTLN